jgi:uncharacterized protein
MTSQKMRKRSTRSTLLILLRKVHLYLGLWGALLGLLFGMTGIILNHRVVMKVPLEKAIQRTVDVELNGEEIKSAEDLSIWLQDSFNLSFKQAPFISIEPEKQVLWAGKDVTQPEKWTISFHKPDQAVTANHYVGSKLVKLEIADSTFWGLITRLHMSIGVSPLWILLADSIAGSFILLSISGLLLWTQFHTVRLTAVIVSVSALFLAITFSMLM